LSSGPRSGGVAQENEECSASKDRRHGTEWQPTATNIDPLPQCIRANEQSSASNRRSDHQ
jgi:hypothetical protein